MADFLDIPEAQDPVVGEPEPLMPDPEPEDALRFENIIIFLSLFKVINCFATALSTEYGMKN